MNRSRFFVIASILGLVFGLAFLLAPAQLMSFYGVTLDPGGQWIGRFLGAQLVGLAIITWVARNAPAGGAMICAFLAFGFTIATLFAYDRLNMPAEFWGGGGKPDATPRQWRINRPPSSYQLILFYEMIHVWKCFFTPAIAFATLSLGLFREAVTSPFGR